jgi:multidrug efflux pump subunit AcrA (membrane-fusion protein)
MRLGRIRAAALVGVGVGVLAIAPWAANGADSTETPGMAISVLRAKSACFSDTVRLIGTMVAREEIQVRPESEGMRIAQLLVEDGDNVTAGQVLARLSRPEGGSQAVQAPVAGTVIKGMMTQVGAMASAMGPPLARIIVAGELELLVDVPSTRMTKIASSQRVRVNVAGLGELSGRVRFVSPEISPITQSGSARIAINHDRRLRLGTFARANIEVGTSCGPSVPLSAVLYGSDGPLVQVVRDNRIQTHLVRVGLLSEGNVEIREGVGAGDLVVKRAGSFLREGDRVRPVVEEDASAAK